MTDEPITPTVGMPATIHLYTDTVPAVVVRVNAKSVTVAQVPVIESSRHRVNDPAEPFPCWAWAGDVTGERGTPERFRMVAPGKYRNGSIGLTLGRAVKITDYRY